MSHCRCLQIPRDNERTGSKGLFHACAEQSFHKSDNNTTHPRANEKAQGSHDSFPDYFIELEIIPTSLGKLGLFLSQFGTPESRRFGNLFWQFLLKE
jgi:hypothetical protein